MRNPAAAVVALVSLLFIGGVVVRVLVPYAGDPSLLLAFGEEAPATLEYAEALLGHVEARNLLGHDGKFFFVLGNDPLLLDPSEHAEVLDRPTYRSQRILYPMLAGAFGLLPPRGVMWGMVLVNVVAMAVGTWGTARLAESMGGSRWWGLAFGFNIGLLSEVAISGGGVVAFACGVWALVLLERGRLGAGIAMFALAALAREAMLLMAWGVAALLITDRQFRKALTVALVPGAVVGSWALYVRWRLGWVSGVTEVQEIGVPFVGVVRALGSWVDSPIDLAAGGAMLLLLLVFTRRAIASRHVLGWATLGFVPLALVFTRQVWLSYFDITRALAPVITGFVLLAFARPRKRETGAVELA